MTWTVKDAGFDRAAIEMNGSKYMIGNGYMGYRGTLEEFGRRELVSCTLSGLYDKVGNYWREPVNAPAAFVVRIHCNGTALSPLMIPVLRHEQSLDFRHGIHRRDTTFATPDGIEVRLKCERFLSLADVHLGALRGAIEVSAPCSLVLEAGIDGDVWDINGPHLEAFGGSCASGVLVLSALTQERKVTVAVAEAITAPFGRAETSVVGKRAYRRIEFSASPGESYEFTKTIAVFTGNDAVDNPVASAVLECHRAASLGYDALLARSRDVWEQRWARSDVEIEGDPEGQHALRYSIYQLLIIAPSHTERASIPARGLSGQVYKGGVFWDTEVFMLPFFDHTQPELARNLIRYRYHTLDGARRKALEYGFRGAYYAWESQDTGDDACTHFNIDDVFTGRPMRTHFRDKQIHISGDVAFAVWRHYQMTGDETVLVDGGAEIILECARFFYSYAWLKPEKNRFELLDVVGPDEYHERVDNNAFTSTLARITLGIALEVLELLRSRHRAFHDALVARLNFCSEIPRLRDMYERLFVPQPDPDTKVIEQFSGYHKLEEVTLEQLKQRILKPFEYLGGTNGLATTTKILKQADVVLMLHLFGAGHSLDVKRSNWRYYEPRTEHGSSLSPCVYALLAAEIGDVEWAYKYFLRTATIDLTGKGKQYVGSLYIGGTHPAANGGAWMAAVLGFGGLRLDHDGMKLTPHLPQSWTSLRFRFCWRGQWFAAVITAVRATITADAGNVAIAAFELAGRRCTCAPGQTVEAPTCG